ncbi:hypothetical protein ACAG96_06420 [Candidatus Izemoplasma sp. B36]|uniref:hypothetical protein n=1 Tax=Candidatus Izemoplasma sp. B36 TaxID=3242468 RepID=UPI0035579D97
MSIYYIISQSGLLKKYYSVKNSVSDKLSESEVIFSFSLRDAKIFSSSEEAFKLLTSNNWTDLSIIDQNGILQNLTK